MKALIVAVALLAAQSITQAAEPEDYPIVLAKVIWEELLVGGYPLSVEPVDFGVTLKQGAASWYLGDIWQYSDAHIRTTSLGGIDVFIDTLDLAWLGFNPFEPFAIEFEWFPSHHEDREENERTVYGTKDLQFPASPGQAVSGTAIISPTID